MAWRDTLSFAQSQPIEAAPPLTPSVAQRWSPFSGPRLGQQSGGTTGFAGTSVYTPNAGILGNTASPLARGDIGLPFSGGTYPAATLNGEQGNPINAVGGALGDLQSHLNIGNIGPYIMERTAVVADQFAQSTVGQIPTPGGIDLNPLDAFLGGVKAISDVAGPVLNLMPNAVRDFSLNQSVANYRSIARVKQRWANGGTMPNGATADGLTALGLSVNLPDEVKAALDQNPDLTQADVDKLLDTYGRQLSYSKGFGGLGGPIANLLGMGVLYAPELLIGGWALGAAKVGLATSELAPEAAALGRAATLAAKIQKFSLLTGAGATALSTAMDAKARFDGNQAALDYWDKLNATTPISNDPNVQLVTAFTANPFTPAMAALKGVKLPANFPVFGGRTMGVLPLAKGLGNLIVNPILGKRLYQLFTSEDQAIAYGAGMYKVPVDTMRTMIGPGQFYENVAQLENEILNQGVGVAFRELPLADKEIFLKTHPGQGHAIDQAFLTQYGPQVTKALDNRDGIGRLWREHHWQYMDMTGPFNPQIAGHVAANYRIAQARTYDFRVAANVTIGIPNCLAPEASAVIRSGLDAVPGDTVTNQWLNEMKANYGGLRRTGGDLVTPEMVKADAIPKGVVAQMLDRGDQGYQDILRKNPIFVRTGTNPVLNAHSSPKDVADAVGTTRQVFLDSVAAPEAVKDWNGLRQFVTEKYTAGPEFRPGSLTPDQIAAKSNEEIQALAHAYVADATAPWLKAGERADAAMTTYRQLAPQLEVLKASGDAPEQVAALEKQLGQLLSDAQLARDPVVPFSQTVADLRGEFGKRNADAQLTQTAMRKVDAMTRLDQLAALDARANSLTEMGSQVFDMVRRNREGAWAWAGDTPLISDKLYDHLVGFVSDPATRQTARMVYDGADRISPTEAGDAQLWDMIRTFVNDRGSRDQFLGGMTNFEKRSLASKLALVRGNSSEESLAEMMSSPGMIGKEAGQARKINGEQAVAEIGQLKEARDNILDGQTTREVQRSADLNVPKDYVDSAQSDQSAGVVYDPEFLTYTHPQNIMELQNLIDVGPTPEAVMEILDRDPLLMRGLEKIVARREVQTEEPVSIVRYLDDMVNGRSPVTGGIAVDPLQSLIPKDFVPPTPGVIEATSALDQAIIDHTPVEPFIGDPGPVPPIEGVPIEQAQRAVGAKRYTTEVSRRLNRTGVSIDSLVDPAAWDNKVGSDTLSAILRGVTGKPPATLSGVLTALREIESGRASALGFGDGVLAEAQRAGQKVLDSYLGKAEHAEFLPGVFMQGINPASMGADIAEWARSIAGRGVEIDPNIGLQYGFKNRPTNEMVTSIISQPFAADEFMSGYFQPFEQRLIGFQNLSALRSVFEPKANSAIRAAMKSRFSNSVIEAGGDAGLADMVWDKWSDYAQSTRKQVLRKDIEGRRYVSGDQARYASMRNIPNNELDSIVHTGLGKENGVLDDYYHDVGPVPESLKNADFSAMLREASSFTRRTLKTLPMGDQLAAAYGGVAHSSSVTTLYYAFRFGMDLRFHAMNKFEAMFLYLGRAGLLPDAGPAMFGMTRDAISRTADDAMANTGYPFSATRADYVYKTLAKEQPAKLGEVVANLQMEDPELMRRALEEIATYDPELSKTIAVMGHDPKAYLKEMDNWYGRLMKSSDPEGLIDSTMADATSRTPAMAEVYGKIAEANQKLLQDIRGTFFGNPNRSQVERLMNSYLLYWPISYQIKVTKWLLRVLFDRVGGLPTNAGGAYLFNQAMAYHQRLMAEDPEYAQTIANNKTLLFGAQMMFPLDPTHPLSWSLSPLVKDACFGGTKALMDIGPIYSYTHLLPQVTTELYRQASDLPIWNQIYPMLTGWQKPAAKAAPAPIDQLTEPLDTTRYGQ